MTTKTKTVDKGTPVQVQEGGGLQDPTTTEFVRRGMQTFEAVNQSLLRMQQEISLLRGTPSTLAPGFGIGSQSPVIPSAPWGNGVMTPFVGQGPATAPAVLLPPYGHQVPFGVPLQQHFTSAPISPYSAAPPLLGQFHAGQAFAGQVPGIQGAPIQSQNPFLVGSGNVPLHDPIAPPQMFGNPSWADPASAVGAFGSLGYPFTQQASGWGSNLPAHVPWAGSAQAQRNLPTESPFGTLQRRFPGSSQGQSFLQSGDLRDAPPQIRTPSCDVVDEGEEYQVRMELPGVTKDELEITCYANSVVVIARSNVDLDDGALLVGEAGNVVYRRTIQLPAEIKTSECKANLHDGILRLDLAKAVPTEAPRRLDVAYR